MSTEPLTSDVELAITGMTWGSCANRIERKLNKLEGVTATVNYATEKAKVTFPETVSTDDLLRTVEAAGYSATLPTPPSDDQTQDEKQSDPLLQRLLICTVLSVPVAAMAMVPDWQFTYWQWASLTLAAPVVVWGAPGRSTGPPGPTCATAPPPWTPSCPSASWRPSGGRSGRSSSAPPANPG
jgi:Cu+-exporting ATPase